MERNGLHSRWRNPGSVRADTAANLRCSADIREAQADNRIISVVPYFRAAEIAYRLMKLARSNPTLLTVTTAQARALIDRFRYRTRRITAIEWLPAEVQSLATG